MIRGQHSINIFLSVLVLLFSVVCPSVLASLEEEDDDDVSSLLETWVVEEARPETKNSDKALTNVQLRPNNSSMSSFMTVGMTVSLPPHSDIMDTLYRNMSIYATPDASAGDFSASIYQSLPGDVQKEQVVILDGAEFEKQFPRLSKALKAKHTGNYVTRPEVLGKHLLTRRVIDAFETFLKAHDGKVGSDKANVFARVVFAYLMDLPMAAMDTRRKSIDFIQYMWKTYKTPSRGERW